MFEGLQHRSTITYGAKILCGIVSTQNKGPLNISSKSNKLFFSVHPAIAYTLYHTKQVHNYTDVHKCTWVPSKSLVFTISIQVLDTAVPTQWWLLLVSTMLRCIIVSKRSDSFKVKLDRFYPSQCGHNFSNVIPVTNTQLLIYLLYLTETNNIWTYVWYT